MDKVVLASEILANEEYSFLWEYANKKINVDIKSLKYFEYHW